ncbi:3-hydroxybutyryl-CoA dehydrogenase [Cohnella sp. CIP 111063]|jgi:3-hydroxybutyryl-CoA dehydrogenase|uniref:3-hydroxyacyl-CoA dehydrogenase family protein n=1 Tax=unclassified Cohnella TaxID=2636738 RepID=UPI000B8C3C8F|nr:MULTISPECIES: 3-hydroxyacyl-CoA dehydrogenase NAD-binding domain-containing protein [unclassified Cohnella]OXS61151.1 3-hydroxybutyryl-CoA dehydrogenase [Cohnella sp. CIP 111063]PRX73706.1 3-hydroxybutyryl-CoA dehydrogenase [Cohnella sp. SGD-V74]
MFRVVGVVGAGTMGQSIAEMLSVKGLDVHLVEKTPEKLQQAREMLELSLDRQLERWAITAAEKKLTLSRIHMEASLHDLAKCDLVIETISEELDSKKEVIRQLDDILASDAIVASNTSTLSLTELAGVSKYPGRVIGMHFVYPAFRIDVVEIIRGLQTSDETFGKTKSFIDHVLSKKGVMVYESPGYVTTRLICLLINEALHLLEEGVASPEDIDDAMSMGYSFEHGPLEMADRFGLDSVLAALERMFREYGELKYRPSFLLKKKVRAGQLGIKTGIGFFKYDKDGERLS